MSEQDKFQGWAIVELMGHRRLAGMVTEVSVAGAGMLRVDIPTKGDGDFTLTQFYPPSSLYALTPVAEDIARAVAKATASSPVHSWEMPRALPPAIDAEVDDSDDRVVVGTVGVDRDAEVYGADAWAPREPNGGLTAVDNSDELFEEARLLIQAFDAFAADDPQFQLLQHQRAFCHNFIIAGIDDPDIANFMRGGMASGRSTAFAILERFYESQLRDANAAPEASAWPPPRVMDASLGVLVPEEAVATAASEALQPAAPTEPGPPPRNVWCQSGCTSPCTEHDEEIPF